MAGTTTSSPPSRHNTTTDLPSLSPLDIGPGHPVFLLIPAPCFWILTWLRQVATSSNRPLVSRHCRVLSAQYCAARPQRQPPDTCHTCHISPAFPGVTLMDKAVFPGRPPRQPIRSSARGRACALTGDEHDGTMSCVVGRTGQRGPWSLHHSHKGDGSTDWQHGRPARTPSCYPLLRARCVRPFEAPFQAQRPMPSRRWRAVAQACCAAPCSTSCARPSIFTRLLTPQTVPVNQQVKAFLVGCSQPFQQPALYLLPARRCWPSTNKGFDIDTSSPME